MSEKIRKDAGVVCQEGILDRVVDPGLCIGCGLCAAICPPVCLTMDSNAYGELAPLLGGGCTNCDLCNKVCPVLDTREAVSELGCDAASVVGFPEGSRAWAGFVTDPAQRARSSSGGLATAVLQHLLTSGRVDCVILGSSGEGVGDRLFRARVVHTADEIVRGCGTKYYPIDLSDALREVVQRKQKAAVVGLPCQVSGIRLASISRRYREAFPFVFGLVCGCQVSTHFTEYLVAHSGASPDQVQAIDYRDKRSATRCFEHRFVAHGVGAPVGKPLVYSKSPFSKAWDTHMFALRGCDFCPDVFGVEADASFMDAWLKEYLEDPHGTSLVVARTPAMVDVMSELIAAGKVNLEEITVADIARSQPGAIKYKRILLPDRVQKETARGHEVPPRLKNLARRGSWRMRRANARWSRNRRLAHYLWTSSLPLRLRAKAVHLLTSRGVGPLVTSIKRVILKLVGRERVSRVRAVLSARKCG